MMSLSQGKSISRNPVPTGVDVTMADHRKVRRTGKHAWSISVAAIPFLKLRIEFRKLLL
jgi:hypothetical protein